MLSLTPRKDQRKSVNEVIRVFSGTLFLGYMHDVSTGGMLMFSEKQLKPNRIYQLHLGLPNGVAEYRNVPILVHCRWSNYDAGLDHYEVGFEFESTPLYFGNVIHAVTQEQAI